MIPGRRRFLAIAAAGVALPLAGDDTATPPIRWQGTALGADASITLHHPDRRRACRAIAGCLAEIERLERALSLHRTDSALVALNSAGGLPSPPPDLLRVLRHAAEVSRVSDGAFDVTVQPLWTIHLRRERDLRGFAAAVEAARTRIDWRRIIVDEDRVAFGLPGMAVTLDGIAQGYVTDRIAERLRDAGFRHVLADLGEYRAVGTRGDGRGWQIGVARPDGLGLSAVLDLADRAVATSSPSGTTFDASGRRHHLFDPRTGLSARGWASVTVVAPTATVADGLSTAIAVAPMDAAAAILSAGGGLEAILVDSSGAVGRIVA